MIYMQLLLAHWANGMYWLFWNVLAMLGLWGAGLIIFTFLENAPWLELVDRGQFFLYSVGFLGQGMYVLTKEHKITTIPNRQLLVRGEPAPRFHEGRLPYHIVFPSLYPFFRWIRPLKFF